MGSSHISILICLHVCKSDNLSACPNYHKIPLKSHFLQLVSKKNNKQANKQPTNEPNNQPTNQPTNKNKTKEPKQNKTKNQNKTKQTNKRLSQAPVGKGSYLKVQFSSPRRCTAKLQVRSRAKVGNLRERRPRCLRVNPGFPFFFFFFFFFFRISRQQLFVFMLSKKKVVRM